MKRSSFSSQTKHLPNKMTISEMLRCGTGLDFVPLLWERSVVAAALLLSATDSYRLKQRAADLRPCLDVQRKPYRLMDCRLI